MCTFVLISIIHTLFLTLQCKDPSPIVRANVCHVLSQAVCTQTMLEICTDNGIVSTLSSISGDSKTKSDENVQRYVAMAVANCCGPAEKRYAASSSPSPPSEAQRIRFVDNARQFGRLGTVANLIAYLSSTDTDVLSQSARALANLTLVSDNCKQVTELDRHSHCILRLSMLVGDRNRELAEAAAETLENVVSSSRSSKHTTSKSS